MSELFDLELEWRRVFEEPLPLEEVGLEDLLLSECLEKRS